MIILCYSVKGESYRVNCKKCICSCTFYKLMVVMGIVWTLVCKSLFCNELYLLHIKLVDLIRPIFKTLCLDCLKTRYILIVLAIKIECCKTKNRLRFKTSFLTAAAWSTSIDKTFCRLFLFIPVNSSSVSVLLLNQLI